MNIFQIIMLLIMVETPDCKCDSQTHCYCIGDNGKSVGSLQQSRAYVQDVNDYYKTNYQYPEDSYNRETAKRITELYLKRWATKSRIGRDVTVQDMARIHNGGPQGYKRESTNPYWNKVKSRITQPTNQQ